MTINTDYRIVILFEMTRTKTDVFGHTSNLLCKYNSGSDRLWSLDIQKKKTNDFTAVIGLPKNKKISVNCLADFTYLVARPLIVNAISGLDITKHWGSGKTSSSDGQRFSWRQQVLQQSYSPKFRDFALEFYTLGIYQCSDKKVKHSFFYHILVPSE